MPRKRGFGFRNGLSSGWNASYGGIEHPGSPQNIPDILRAIRSPGGLNSSFTESGLDVTDASTEDQQFLGYVRGSIVGLQYYDGEVNEKEMVALLRQPDNAYDCNAIKVENTWGEQVGHIKRELAKPVAQICDNKLARIEGVVPFGNRNAFRIPVDISFWGPLENVEAIKAKLSRHSFSLKDSPLSMAPGGGSSMGQSSAPSYQPQNVLGASVKLSQAAMKTQLDKLFEDIKSGDKISLKEPSPAVTSSLYPHQKQALHWMALRENSEDLPPFWEMRGVNFLNTLTNFSSSKRPNSIHGGILADDMGLGKTLSVISLILSNHLDNGPMFQLVGKTPSLLSTAQYCPSSSSRGGEAKDDVILIDDSFEEANPEWVEVPPGNDSKDDSIIVIDDDEDWEPATEITTSTQRGTVRPQRSTRNSTIKYIVIDDSEDNCTPEKKPKRSRTKVTKKKSAPTKKDKSSAALPTMETEISGETNPNRPSFERRLAETDGRPSSTLIICPVSVLGNWMVIQRRSNSSVDFYRGWSDYKVGFGDKLGDFWLGNEVLHYITSQDNYTFHMEVISATGDMISKSFSSCIIGSESTNYKASFLRDRGFSTHDRDNDRCNWNCAELHQGGWWYGKTCTACTSFEGDVPCNYAKKNGSCYSTCTNSNLNGQFGTSLFWIRTDTTCGIIKAQMKIIPT